MDYSLIIKGFLVGVLVAAPIGPTGILWLRRILSIGRMYGFLSGVGSAVGEIIYASALIFGISWISEYTEKYKNPLQITVGILFILLGLYTFFRTIDAAGIHEEKKKYLKAFSSGLVITMANPHLMFMFMGFFVFMKIGDISHNLNASLTLLGSIFVGSVSIWAFFVAIYSQLKHRFSPRLIKQINHTVGVALIIFGIIALVQILY